MVAITFGNVLFTATGASTSAQRSSADRWTDVINVKDYGAVGDGVNDDTAEIQAAVNSLNSGSNGGRGKIYFPPGSYKISSTIFLPTTQTGITQSPNFFIEGAGGPAGATGNVGILATVPFNGFVFDDIPTGGNALHVGTYPTVIRNLIIKNNYSPANIYLKNLVGAASWALGDSTISITNASGGAGVLEGAIFFSNTTFSTGAVPGYVGFCGLAGVTVGSPTVFTIGDAAGAQIPSGGAADNIFAVQGFFANSTFTTASTSIVMNAANPGLAAGNYLVWDWSWVTSGASPIPKCLGISTLSTWTTAGTSITLSNASNFANKGANDLLVFTPMSGGIRRTGGECMTIDNCYVSGVLPIWLDETNVPDTSINDATPASFFTSIRNCVITNGVASSAAIGNIGIYGGQGTYIENCDVAASWNGVRLWESNTGLYGGRSETNCYGIVLGGILHNASSNVGNGACVIANTEVEGTWAAAILNDNDSMRFLTIENVISSVSHQNACYGLYINSGICVTVSSCAFTYGVGGNYGGCWNPSFQGAGTPAAIYIANSTNPQYISFINTQASSQPGLFNTNGTVPLSGPAWRLPTTAASGVEFSNCNNPPQIFTFANLPTSLSVTGQISADGSGTGAAGTVMKYTAGTVSPNHIIGSRVTGGTVSANTFIVSHTVNGLNQAALVNNSQTVSTGTAMTVYPMVDGDEYYISNGPSTAVWGDPITSGSSSSHMKVRWDAPNTQWIRV